MKRKPLQDFVRFLQERGREGDAQPYERGSRSSTRPRPAQARRSAPPPLSLTPPP